MEVIIGIIVVILAIIGWISLIFNEVKTKKGIFVDNINKKMKVVIISSLIIASIIGISYGIVNWFRCFPVPPMDLTPLMKFLEIPLYILYVVNITICITTVILNLKKIKIPEKLQILLIISNSFTTIFGILLLLF